MMEELLFREEVYAIIGGAIEVHRQLGSGFAEAIYQESMEIELGLRSIPFIPQMPLGVHYKGHHLQKGFFADLVCYGRILVELKALSKLSGTEEAQVLNYLKASGLRVALLINFGDPGRLDWHRFIR